MQNDTPEIRLLLKSRIFLVPRDCLQCLYCLITISHDTSDGHIPKSHSRKSGNRLPIGLTYSVSKDVERIQKWTRGSDVLTSFYQYGTKN